jgi:type IV secretion system protein TrbL
MACSLTDPGGCLADLAGSAAGSIADSAFSSIAKDFGNAADSAVNWLWEQISGATAISLTGSAMVRDLAIVSALAVVVATGLFIIQIIASVLRRDGAGLGRAVKGLLIAFMGSVAAIAITSLLLSAVDALSAGFVQAATGDSIRQMGSTILSTTAVTSAGNPAVVLVLALIVLGAVVVVWGAMMVRKLLIIVAAVFAPLAFAGATSDISSSWVRKWIETMVALIVSKLILVIIFVIGLGVLTDGLGESTGPSANASATQSVTQTIIGALILLMGGFAPFLAIKLVHFGGEHFEQIHGHARGAVAGAQSVAAAPQKAQRLAGGVGIGGGASPAGLRAGGSGAGGSNGSMNAGSGASSPVGAGSSSLASSSAGPATSSSAVGGAAAAAGPVGVAAGAAGAAKGALDKKVAQVGEASSSAASSGAPGSSRPATPPPPSLAPSPPPASPKSS